MAGESGGEFAAAFGQALRRWYAEPSRDLAELLTQATDEVRAL